MDRNQKKTALIAGLIAVLLFSGGFVGGRAFDSLHGPMIELRHLSRIQTMEKNLSTRSLAGEDLTSEVFEILDLSYEAAERYQVISGGFFSELEHEYLCDDPTCTGPGESKAFDGFLKDLQENNLVAKYDELSGFVITPDLSALLERYRENLTEDAVSYLEFRQHELDNHLYNSNINSIDMDETVRRIDLLEERLRAGNTPYNDVYQELLEYYYGVFEGRDHEFFVDLNTLELTSYARKMYEKFAERTDRVGEISSQILAEGPWQQEWRELEENA